MTNADEGKESKEQSEALPHRVHLPGFIADEQIGLGDVIRRVTLNVGIKPCGGCDRRAAALNGWMVFTPGRPKSGYR